jgi:hypothetical protein
VIYPAPRFRVGGKSDPSGVTVYDEMTSLRWQRSAASDPLAWDAAKAYCTSLGAGCRLPTSKELLSLVDWTKSAAIDLDVFPDTPPGDYWAVTPAAGSAGDALTVSFGDATYTGSRTAPVTEAHQVRCILGQGVP